MNISETVAAISTPQGEGGIAVIRLSGDKAFDVAEKVFKPKNKNKSVKNAGGYTAMFGDFIHDNKIFDQGVSIFYRAPKSYTGENVVELCCHGGETVSKMLLRACIDNGARPAMPGEFTKRAVLNGMMSLSQAEAVTDIIKASSEKAALLANVGINGALKIKIDNVKEQLILLAGHLAAFTDYPEEEVEELSPQNFLNTVNAAKNEINNLVINYDKGTVIRRGISAVIAGSPNVGKSTLFNLLSGFERAIVTPIAGTTRDIVKENINIAGINLIVSDTAGLHETDDFVEAEGIKRSYKELEQAGIIIAVFDGSQKLDEASMELAEKCKGRPALCVLNKNDLKQQINKEEMQDYFTKVISVSANNLQSRELIEDAVLQVLNLGNVNQDDMLLANERQYFLAVRANEALKAAADAIKNGHTIDAAGVCLDDALNYMAEITGENVNETVIDSIFERFCVGK